MAFAPSSLPCLPAASRTPRPGRQPRSRNPRRSHASNECCELFAHALEGLGLGAFSRALASTGQIAELGSASPFTLLAPSDEAFAELPPSVFEQPALLHRLLRFHMIPGELVDHAQMRAEPGLTTAIGQRVLVELEDLDQDQPQIEIDGARLVRADLELGAGLVHVVDRVLVPAELDLIELLDLSDAFPRLVSACEVLGLEGLLRGALPYTLLAPRALETLPTWEWHALLRPEARTRLGALIRRHLVAGRAYLDPGVRLRNLEGQVLAVGGPRDRVTLADRRVAIGDIEARNGLIHVIDGLLGS